MSWWPRSIMNASLRRILHVREHVAQSGPLGFLSYADPHRVGKTGLHDIGDVHLRHFPVLGIVGPFAKTVSGARDGKAAKIPGDGNPFDLVLQLVHLVQQRVGRHSAVTHRIRPFDAGHPREIFARRRIRKTLRYRYDHRPARFHRLDDLPLLGLGDRAPGMTEHSAREDRRKKQPHATHSDTGAFASCSGWQTMSTSVGSSAASAALSAGASSFGSTTRQLFRP